MSSGRTAINLDSINYMHKFANTGSKQMLPAAFFVKMFETESEGTLVMFWL